MCKVLEERDEKIKREFSAKIEAQAAEIAELKRQLAEALKDKEGA